MIVEAVHSLTAEENPRKPQLGNHLMKGLYDLQMRSIRSHSTSGREKERTGWDNEFIES